MNNVTMVVSSYFIVLQNALQFVIATVSHNIMIFSCSFMAVITLPTYSYIPHMLAFYQKVLKFFHCHSQRRIFFSVLFKNFQQLRMMKNTHTEY